MTKALRPSLAWDIVLGLALGATAYGLLATRLAFVPWPWPDASAFYLAGLELVRWPPAWRMHSQAAFVPSYDQANFNTMPALPLLLGLVARSGLLSLMTPTVLTRAVSLVPLLVWAALLWQWLSEKLAPRLGARDARLVATAVGACALWDPVLRWGTLVVRPEAWIGLGWLVILRELDRWENEGGRWNRTAWRLALGLALSAYFHFEAITLVPAVVAALGLSREGLKRSLGVGARTAALLGPWLGYVALHLGLFHEQLAAQFGHFRNSGYWFENGSRFFKSLFITYASPVTLPPYFDIAKMMFWLGLALLAARTALKPRRTTAAAATFFAATFLLWSWKLEVWYTTLCHFAYWGWMAVTLVALARDGKSSFRKSAWAGALLAITGLYAILSLACFFTQAVRLPGGYNWTEYGAWIDCIDRALGPAASRPELRVWQPGYPDVLVDLSARHRGWDLTRASDFPARKELAFESLRSREAIIFTYPTFEVRDDAEYLGPMRPRDRRIMSYGSDNVLGSWEMVLPQIETSANWGVVACQNGPFWAAIAVRR